MYLKARSDEPDSPLNYGAREMTYSFDNYYEAYAFMVANKGGMWFDELAGHWIVTVQK